MRLPTLLGLTLLSSFVACGGDNSEQPTAPTQPPSVSKGNDTGERRLEKIFLAVQKADKFGDMGTCLLNGKIVVVHAISTDGNRHPVGDGSEEIKVVLNTSQGDQVSYLGEFNPLFLSTGMMSFWLTSNPMQIGGATHNFCTILQ